MPSLPRPGTENKGTPNATLLLHVGYMKTASTWLDRAVFRNREAGFTSPWRHRETIEKLLLVNPFAFDPDEAKAFFAPGIAAARGESLVPVLSNERLTGEPHSGGYDSKTIADRLAAVFPGARVLIVIREQSSMILSSYKQYIATGGAASLKSYLFPGVKGPARLPRFRFEQFEYHWLIAAYEHLFGSDRVLVLPLERLRQDPRGFVASIEAFAGGRMPESLPLDRVNPSLSWLSVGIKRRVNHLFVRDPLNPAPLLPLPINNRLTNVLLGLDRLMPDWLVGGMERKKRAELDAAIGDRYCESNRKTMTLTGLHLDPYGYRC